ncbi:MAG: rRNA maturation RNase YbeY [Gammaproteobacteria bacterium]|nr:rRNA maturation RNase YbeY [Gammaproteobacteria bacterium]
MALELAVQLAAEGSDPPDEADFRAWVEAALAGRRAATELVIRIVDAEEGRALNATWRGRDRPTNVLSFPADLPPELDLPLLGDLVLCAPVVVAEAREQGKSVSDHYAHLTIHGVLHLLGFDHEEEIEAQRMEAEERRILAGLGIDDPY